MLEMKHIVQEKGLYSVSNSIQWTAEDSISRLEGVPRNYHRFEGSTQR